MKRWAIRLTAFFITVALGFAVTASVARIVDDLFPFDTATVPEIEPEESERPIIEVDIVPTFDPSVNYAKVLPVKLLQTGEFHADEAPYRDGEEWLGLFKDGDTYTLDDTRVRIKRKLNDLYETSVKTERKGESVFLLRGRISLREGVVETVFDDIDNDSDSYFGDDPEKSFFFREHKYSLRVENASNGYLEQGSVLVLEMDGKRQILRSLEKHCDDCGWSVEWVGDLDNDGLLDFLLDLNRHYNSYEPTLFLSSPAKNDDLVSVVAGFHAVGC